MLVLLPSPEIVTMLSLSLLCLLLGKSLVFVFTFTCAKRAEYIKNPYYSVAHLYMCFSPILIPRPQHKANLCFLLSATKKSNKVSIQLITITQGKNSTSASPPIFGPPLHSTETDGRNLCSQQVESQRLCMQAIKRSKQIILLSLSLSLLPPSPRGLSE